MAIYGIGAYYGRDVSKKFISKGLACVGWEFEDAPSLHNVLKHIKVGDLIYIKSQTPKEGLFIKAVGIVMDDEVREDDDLGACLKVKYVWEGWEAMGRVIDRDPYNVRFNTIYEELDPTIQKKVIGLLLTPNYPKIKRRKLRP
jgi:hypothetical protein